MTLCTAVPKSSTNRMQVPLSRPSITQGDIEAVLEVLNSPSLSMGPKLPASQRAMADYSV
jgi:perosamine synthetase